MARHPDITTYNASDHARRMIRDLEIFLSVALRSDHRNTFLRLPEYQERGEEAVYSPAPAVLVKEARSC